MNSIRSETGFSRIEEALASHYNIMFLNVILKMKSQENKKFMFSKWPGCPFKPYFSSTESTHSSQGSGPP